VNEAQFFKLFVYNVELKHSAHYTRLNTKGVYMSLYTLIVIFSFAGFLLHLLISRVPKTRARTVELLLLYQLVFSIGVLGVLSFFGHTFLPLVAAKYLRWLPSPFQQELANASLGFGVIGMMCIWYRGHFWTATVIGSSIWLFADAVDHIVDMFYNNNFSTINTGIVFYSDLLTPVLLIVLLILNYRLKESVLPRHA